MQSTLITVIVSCFLNSTCYGLYSALEMGEIWCELIDLQNHRSTRCSPDTHLPAKLKMYYIPKGCVVLTLKSACDCTAGKLSPLPTSDQDYSFLFITYDCFAPKSQVLHTGQTGSLQIRAQLPALYSLKLASKLGRSEDEIYLLTSYQWKPA